MTTLRPGALVRLVSTTDPHTRIVPGSSGTVEHMDDAGTVHVRWEDGSTLGLIPGEDEWEVVHERWWNAPFVQTYPLPEAEENDR
jgi:hypothetical protein